MRYVISMVVAIVFALVATLFISSPLASMVADRFTFESPDEVDDLHTAIFMLGNLAALLVGWVIGWLVSGRLVRPASAPQSTP
jgi:hypothetical protein